MGVIVHVYDVEFQLHIYEFKFCNFEYEIFLGIILHLLYFHFILFFVCNFNVAYIYFHLVYVIVLKKK